MSDSCTLCDLPTPDPPVTGDGVDGTFCCRGCLEVASTLEDVEDTDAETANEVIETGDAASAEGETAYLSVDGMHCGTCEVFVESQAVECAGVGAAEASYPSNTVKIVYDEERTDAGSIAEAISGLGYAASEREQGDHDTETIQQGRLLVGGFFGMMTMVWYVLFLYPAYLGLEDFVLFDLAGPAGTYLLANVWIMATIVLGYTGFPILRGAYVSLRAGHPNMDLLVALAATTAYAYSVVAFVLGQTELYFDITVVVIVVVTLGNYYESRIKRRAAGGLGELTAQQVKRARRRTADGTETVGVERLAPGEEVVVESGERVPVDGTVCEGSAAVDESLVTGESLPERKQSGDAVIGGSLVTDGGLVVTVAEGATNTLDRLIDHLWSIQSSRPGVQRLADRIAAVFVPGVLAIAVLAFVVHLVIGSEPTAALLTGLAVLIVSCPCALGLATPLAVASGIRAALDRGIVVTSGAAFERAETADVVAFDKTGTLTTGRLTLLEVPEEDILRRAAALEQFAAHPISRTLVEAADGPFPEVEDVGTHPGRGVGGTVDSSAVLVGSLALFEERGWEVPESLQKRARTASDRGLIPAVIGKDGEAEAVAVAGDEPRPEWEETVETLAADHEVVVITGDSERATARFREHSDVDRVFAGVPPEAKAETVRRLGTEGTVAMVGDGSNDAPALAAADLGIAMANGTELAAEAADAIITDGELSPVPSVFSLLTGTRRRIRQNLAWAFLYNAIALPIAVAGLLNPLLAAVAMATSSLLVVGNSARSLS
ncbi:heavy metal translocating P-type ATPase [Halorhabdus amylolytica]|uniref:heavy metal translocating P-type ATPase n=1 Tax=Halorhabdus amylolytica TaxID=2559573 RepID=UPI0010AB2029|nr:heavy metal translocating P-type ATPase [Halorhabdus amylolytica]